MFISIVNHVLVLLLEFFILAMLLSLFVSKVLQFCLQNGYLSDLVFKLFYAQ